MKAGVVGVLTVIGGMVVVAYKGYQRSKSAFQPISKIKQLPKLEVDADLKKEFREKVAFFQKELEEKVTFNDVVGFKKLLSDYLNDEDIIQQRLPKPIPGVEWVQEVQDMEKEEIFKENARFLKFEPKDETALRTYIKAMLLLFFETELDPSFEQKVREWLEKK